MRFLLAHEPSIGGVHQLAIPPVGITLDKLLGGFIGLYAIVIVTTWLLRAATLVIRADSGFFDAMKEGAYIAFEHPSYTVLQLATAGGLLAFGIAFWIAIPLLIPGLLALLEIVSFEETAGDGALGIVSAYQG